MKKSIQSKNYKGMKSTVELDKKIDPLKKAFYDLDNELKLVRSADSYFNWRSTEFNKSTLNTKLKELGFLLSKGFNLKECISEFKQTRNTYTISSLSQTLIFYIMYIRYRNYYHSISEILLTQSENLLIKLFIDELQVVYNPEEDDINGLFWTDSLVWEEALRIESHQSDKDKFISVVCTNEMVRKTLEYLKD